jgi:hypothetical protein
VLVLRSKQVPRALRGNRAFDASGLMGEGHSAAASVARALLRLTIDAMDAWNDDGRFAEYRLDCRLLDVPPKRTSVTAT